MHFTVWDAVLKVIVLRTADTLRVAVNFYKTAVYREGRRGGSSELVAIEASQSETLNVGLAVAITRTKEDTLSVSQV